MPLSKRPRRHQEHFQDTKIYAYGNYGQSTNDQSSFSKQPAKNQTPPRPRARRYASSHKPQRRLGPKKRRFRRHHLRASQLGHVRYTSILRANGYETHPKATIARRNTDLYVNFEEARSRREDLGGAGWARFKSFCAPAASGVSAEEDAAWCVVESVGCMTRLVVGARSKPSPPLLVSRCQVPIPPILKWYRCVCGGGGGPN